MAEEIGGKTFGRIALVTMPGTLLLGLASGWLANSGYANPWFAALAKPAFMPPAWSFGVVWTVLYIMIGAAAAMILAEPRSPRRTLALVLFAVQLALNLAWSPIFFAGHDIGLAKIVIFLMTVIAAAAAGQFLRIKRDAGLLMLPYLGWLVFAAILTSTIHTLNPDAGRSLFG